MVGFPWACGAVPRARCSQVGLTLRFGDLALASCPSGRLSRPVAFARAPNPFVLVMSEEIRDYDEELSGLIEEIQNGLTVLRKPKMSSAAKSERISELSGRLQRAKQVLQSYKVEMRDLPREQTASYEIRAREQQSHLQALHSELQVRLLYSPAALCTPLIRPLWGCARACQVAKEEAERQQVGLRSLDQMTTQEVMHEASKVQDASMLKVKRMQQQVAETSMVGTATATALKGQTEQLKNIDADIIKVKSNLSRADLLLRQFMRKMMTDKLIMSFLCLIVIGVGVIIVWKVVDPKGQEAALTPTQVVSPTSGRRLLAPDEAFQALLTRRRHAVP